MKFSIFAMLVVLMSAKLANSQIPASVSLRNEQELSSRVDVLSAELAALKANIAKMKTGVFVDLHQGTTDSEKIENAIQEAKFQSSLGNKTVTVYFGEHVYRLDRPIVSPSHVAFASMGNGHRSTRLVFRNIKPEWWPATQAQPNPVRALFTLIGGTAVTFSGIEIRTDKSKISNVVGLNVLSLSSSEIERSKIDLDVLNGVDNIGLRIQRTTDKLLSESVYFEKLDIKADLPIYVVSGDSLAFRDLDLTAGKTDKLPSACVAYGPKSGPDHHIFEGAQTWQRADHAIWIDTQRATSSSGLVLRNVRYEQSTGNKDKPAWHIVFRGTKDSAAMLESLTMDGCRNSPRAINTNIKGVRKIDVRINCFLFGKPAQGSLLAKQK